jgi:L-lactate dehydrogenase complex protein LldF
MAWKIWKLASLKRGLMNTGSGKLKNKLVNKLFKSWNKHRSDLEFSEKTFNQMWRERVKSLPAGRQVKS